jgi:hypothetical protein
VTDAERETLVALLRHYVGPEFAAKVDAVKARREQETEPPQTPNRPG